MAKTLTVYPDAARVEQALLRLSRGRSFVDASGVLTFGELIDTCDAARVGGLTLLQPLLGRVIVSKCARELPSGPYGSFALEPSFARGALDTIRHLQAQRARPEQLVAAAAAVGGNTGARAQWLAQLWSAFEARLHEQRLATSEQLLSLAAEKLAGGLPDGLRTVTAVEIRQLIDISPLRLHFIRSLELALRKAGGALELWLPATGAPLADAMVDEVMADLERAGAEGEAWAFKELPELTPLAPLASRLFTDDARPTSEPALHAFDAATPRHECREIARQVRRLADQGVPLESIAVVYREPGPDTEAMLEALAELSLPARGRLGVPLSKTPLGSAALSLPQLVEEQYPAAGMARLLELMGVVAPAGVLQEAGVRDDVLGARAREGAYALRLNALADRLRLRTRTAARAAEVGGLAETVARVIDTAAALKPVDSLQNHVEAWAQAIDALGLLQPAADEQRDSTLLGPMHREAQRALAREQAARQALAAFVAQVRGCAASASPAPVSLRELQRWLHDAASDVNLYAKGPRTGAVQVLDARDVAGRAVSHVFVAGLTDGRFPRAFAATGVLSEEQRRALNYAGGARLFRVSVGERNSWVPLRLAEDRLLFGLTLATATQSVTLSRARADAAGKELIPSPFFKELDRHVADFQSERRVVAAAPPLEQSMHRLEFRLRAMLDGRPVDEPWYPAAQTLAAAERERLAFFTDETAPAAGYSGHVGSHPALAAQLAFEATRPLSAKRLDTWGTCAFKGFAGELLGLSPPEPVGEEMSRSGQGTVMHAALERLLEGYTRGEPLDEPQLLAAVDGALEAVTRERPAGHERLLEIVRRRVIGQLGQLVASGLLLPFGPSFRPVALEQSVRFTVPAALPNESDVAVFAALDRIDTDGERLLVVDYKSRAESKEERRRRLLAREWQLPLYALAVRHWWAQSGQARGDLSAPAPVDAAWLSLKEGKTVRLSEVAPAMSALLATDAPSRTQALADEQPNLANTLHALVARLRQGDFGPRSLECEYCQFRPVCRVTSRTLHEEVRR